MADGDSELMREFEEFLSAKKAKEKESADAEDFDVEIWDKDGRGVRTKRSHAKPFLQTLGIDLDSESEGSDDDKSGDGKSGDSKSHTRKSTGKQSSNATAGGIAAKYFTKPK